MARNIDALRPRDAPLRAQMPSGGNGHAVPEQPDRLTRIEALLMQIQRQLDVQFQRIADLQVQLDRSIIGRKISPER